MVHPRRNSEAAMRAAERRRREDEAPRLIAEVPTLRTLDLEVEEHMGSGAVTSQHVRRVVVERAPALFDIPCSDRACKEGGHDLTRPILTELRRGSETFTGQHACEGSVGNNACTMNLRYVAKATYQPPG